MKKEISVVIILSVGFFLSACKPKIGNGEAEVRVEAEAKGKKAESQHLVTLTSDTFQKEVLQSEQLVMVDFWAPWCTPCLELAPAVSELADDYAGKVKVGKVDVNETINKELLDKYVGEGIPLIVFFKGGEKVDQSLGLVSKGELVEIIKKHL